VSLLEIVILNRTVVAGHGDSSEIYEDKYPTLETVTRGLVKTQETEDLIVFCSELQSV
jgi:hypothetical protein